MNSSTRNIDSGGKDFLDGTLSSFFTWVLHDLIPFVIIVVYILFALLAIFLNIVTLAVSRRARLHKECVHAFIIQLCLVDLMACVFVLLPALVSVASGEAGLLSNDYVCRFQEVVFIWCFLITYGSLVAAVIERVIRLIDNKLYLRSFGNICVLRLIILSIWLVDLLISLMTLTAAEDIGYRNDQYQCALDYGSHPVIMHIIFTFTVYLPHIVYLICFMIIFYKRANSVSGGTDPRGRSIENITTEGYEAGRVVVHGATSVFYIDLNKSFSRSNTKVGSTPLPQITPQATTKANSSFDAKATWHTSVKRIRERSRFFRIFQDRFDDLDHHQSMTYLVTWSVITVCWWLYFIAALSQAYGDGCSACSRVGVLLALATYCFKPLIYIGHNRWYRAQCWKYIQNVSKTICCCGQSRQ